MEKGGKAVTTPKADDKKAGASAQPSLWVEAEQNLQRAIELARPFAGPSVLDTASKDDAKGKGAEDAKAKAKPVDAKEAALASTLLTQAYKGLYDVYTGSKNKVLAWAYVCSSLSASLIVFALICQHRKGCWKHCHI